MNIIWYDETSKVTRIDSIEFGEQIDIPEWADTFQIFLTTQPFPGFTISLDGKLDWTNE